MGYLVYIDEKPTSDFVDSIEDAKQFAAPFIVNKPSLRIESFVAPAPSQILIYDHQINEWVEQV